MAIKVQLSKVKETKGAIQYKEDAMPGTEKIGIFYVRKTAFPTGAPMTITLTIDAEVL